MYVCLCTLSTSHSILTKSMSIIVKFLFVKMTMIKNERNARTCLTHKKFSPTKHGSGDKSRRETSTYELCVCGTKHILLYIFYNIYVWRRRRQNIMPYNNMAFSKYDGVIGNRAPTSTASTNSPL